MYEGEEQGRDDDGHGRGEALARLSVLAWFEGAVKQSSEYHTSAQPFLEERGENRNADEVDDDIASCHALEGCLEPFRHLRHSGIDNIHCEAEGECRKHCQSCAAEDSYLAEILRVEAVSVVKH